MRNERTNGGGGYLSSLYRADSNAFPASTPRGVQNVVIKKAILAPLAIRVLDTTAAKRIVRLEAKEACEFDDESSILHGGKPRCQCVSLIGVDHEKFTARRVFPSKS